MLLNNMHKVRTTKLVFRLMSNFNILCITTSRKMSRALATHICKRGVSCSVRDARRRAILDRVIRVDQAGEFGANRIYAGQHAVLGNSSVGPVIKEMWDQEKEHLKTFENLVKEHRARPTLMMPIWHVAGFALGAGSALLGKEAAMACTVAVEDVIADHYNGQIRQLMEEDPEGNKELLKTIKKFRDEEMVHHDTGLQNDAEKAPFYSALTQAIKVGCRGAIWVSERI